MMDRHTIEKRDEELVEKFRAVVASKKRRKKMARIRLFALFLVVVCSGLIFFSNKPSRLPETEKDTNQSNRIVLSRVEDVSAPIQITGEMNAPQAEEIQSSENKKDLNIQSPVPEIHAAEPVTAEKDISDQPVPILSPRVKTSGKIGIPEVSQEIFAATDIQIAAIITCENVKNRQAVSPENEFSLKEGANPFVWMDVRSKKTPYKLRHVYYHNGRRYCSVPLAIHYPRMRTWSNVTLRYPYEVGKWRVDVITGKEEILSRVEFTVTP